MACYRLYGKMDSWRFQPRKTILSRLLKLWLGLCLAALVFATPAHAKDDAVSRLQVVYLYNFTRYIRWPDDAITDDFNIAVIGDDAFAKALQTLSTLNKQVQGRPIRIRVSDDNEPIEDIQILFLGRQATSRLPDILARTKGKPVLLVSDSKNMAEHGIAINFFLQPDILGKGYLLRFEINPQALADRGLEVMSDLYDVAEIVK